MARIMQTHDETARQAAWSAYWAAGQLHSCVGTFDEGYGGAIGTFWQEVARSAAPGRTLDLATGNGAIPRLLLALAAGDARLRIEAVDLAGIAPAWHDPATTPTLRFHAGVAMEALPFPDAGFDLVTSQFGFEYARRDAALAEVLRVLAPGGRIAFVMHHADSVLVRVAREEAAHEARLLAGDGLLAAAAAVLPWFARARAGEDLTGRADAESARRAYNAAVAGLAEAAQASSAPDLLLEARAQVHRLLQQAGPDPASSLARLAAYRDAIRAAGLRTAELVAHALDEATARALADAIAAARSGHAVTVRPLVQAEGLLGWGLLAASREPATLPAAPMQAPP